MYETFYGLKEKPFSMIPDPEYLFLSTKHQRALTLLEYGLMNQAGFSVICGDTGAGKTTLIRRLLNEMGNDTVVGLITNTHQSFGDLLNWVLMAFGIDPENKSKAQMHQMFISFLVEQYAQNKRAVLIVDEAQNMNADTLEELRMLSNINADKDQVLQVILAGQPALRETLRMPELMQFAQRIAVDYYLEALNKEETAIYIKHRLAVAGAEREIFTPEACAAIYNYSGGTPRLINLLCDMSLVYGFAEQTKVVDVNLVNDVVREQHSHSVVPTYRKQEAQSYDRNKIKDSEKNQLKERIEGNIGIAGKAANIDELFSNEVNEAESKIKLKVQKEDFLPEQPEQVESNAVEESETHYDVAADGDAKNNNDEADVVVTGKEEDKVSDIDSDIGSNKNSEMSDRKEDESHYNYTSAHGSRRKNDLYPVIQVEEKVKSNINGVIIGFSSGLFIASILLVAFVFMYGQRSELVTTRQVEAVVESKGVTNVVNSIADEDIKKIEKERDAVLEINRALERERDAALAAAKVQEEMRAAEKRAAEMIAEQERKAAIEVRRAKERARQAEIDAARAKERERLAFEKAELERVKAEKIQLEKELIQIENIETSKKIETSTVSAINSDTVEKAFAKDVLEKNLYEASDDKPIVDKSTKFIRNPCDSPSAKFLSTCKK